MHELFVVELFVLKSKECLLQDAGSPVEKKRIGAWPPILIQEAMIEVNITI